MVLSSQLKGINIETLLQELNEAIIRKYDVDVKWIVKPPDEAIQIPCSNLPIIDLTMDDLSRGVLHVSPKIAPAIRPFMKYCNKTELWYYASTKNIWTISKKIDITMITDTIISSMNYLETSINKEIHENIDAQLSAQKRNDKEGEEKEKKKGDQLLKKHKEFLKQLNNIGSPGYSSKLKDGMAKYLREDHMDRKMDKMVGRFVFADGILDLRSNIFTEGFRLCDYVSEFSIDREFKSLRPCKIKSSLLRKKLKQIFNNNEEHLEYNLHAIGHSMTGDASKVKAIYFFKDGTMYSSGDNGKTWFFVRLSRTFPNLVTTTPAKAIEKGNEKAHKSISQWKNKRIIFIDEGTRKPVNAELIKIIGNGERIKNEVLFATEEPIDIVGKLFICSNHMLNMSSKDDSTAYNRLIQINLCSHFDRTGKRLVEDEEKLEFIADQNLGKLIDEDYQDEVISLILEYASRFYSHGIPPLPREFVDAADTTRILNDPFSSKLYETFDKGALKDQVSLDEICKLYIDLKRPDVVKEMERIGLKYDRNMKSLGKKLNAEGKEIYIKGGFSNLKKKEQIIEEDELVPEDELDEKIEPQKTNNSIHGSSNGDCY